MRHLVLLGYCKLERQSNSRKTGRGQMGDGTEYGAVTRHHIWRIVASCSRYIYGLSTLNPKRPDDLVRAVGKTNRRGGETLQLPRGSSKITHLPD